MPVSGLVVSLADDQQSRDSAIDAIAAQPGIEIGPTRSDCLTIVTDTDSRREDKRLWDWLCRLPGVRQVEVAFVGFDTEPESSDANRRGQKSGC